MISLDPIFKNHIVFQCDKPVVMTGSTFPLNELTVELDGEHYNAQADHYGCFSVSLGCHSAGGPFRIRITAGREETVIEDVLFGDVWLAGGQSNMELRLEDCDALEITDEQFLSEIRFYDTSASSCHEWINCDENSRLKMSAVAYYFACEIRRNTGHPVGIIESCIGGTSIASWISKAALNNSNAGLSYMEEFRKQTEGITEETYRKQLADFKKKADAWNADTKKFRREHPEKSWTEILKAFGTAPWPEPVWNDSPFCPGYPFETMIRPVTVCSIKGFLYYQGEADTWNYKNYPELMELLICEWRSAWKDDALPFLFVQLPMFRFSDSPEDYDWANQRLSQDRVAKTVPNAHMAVLTDQGELDNIHPTSKRPVGERLAKLALRYVYGLPVEAEAPEADRIVYENGEIRIKFINTGGSLVCADAYVKAFEISVGRECFEPIDGRVNGDCVILYMKREQSSAINKIGIIKVRYAFAAFCEVNLFGVNGLPAKSFCIQIGI